MTICHLLFKTRRVNVKWTFDPITDLHIYLVPFGFYCILTLADCICSSRHSSVATNCYRLILWTGQMPACSAIIHMWTGFAFPDHCGGGIFQVCLFLGLSLWDPRLWRVFHSVVLHPVRYPCWDHDPFLSGDLNALSLSCSWEMPHSSSENRSQAATSGWFLKGQESGQ